MNISTIDRLLKAERMPHARVTNDFKPDWNAIPHKNMSPLSRDEIKEELRELVKKEAEASTEKEKKALADRRQELFTMFESFAAPDRKAYFEEALEAMKRNGGHFLQKATMTAERKDVFDFIAERDYRKMGIDISEDNDVVFSRKKTEQEYPLPSGGSVKATSVPGRGIHLDVFHGKQQILTVDKDGKVKHELTTEERLLRNEITEFYVGLRKSTGSASAPPDNSTFDTKA